MEESNGLVLQLTRALEAPREDVYGAITEPDRLSRWWGPRGFTIPSLDFDPRVGAAYRIDMQPPEGEAFHLRGEFREVDPPARLAYTFIWDPPDPDDRETVAELDLRDLGTEGTEIVLTQGAFATEERRALHEGGWSDSFDKLAELLS
jgi:uncharacterized protein YndB with AHSA1/START domain